MSSVMTTLVAGTAAMFVTRTTYSSAEPGSAAPPPTTVTCFVIESCWPCAHHDDRRFRAGRGIAVAIGQQVRQLHAVHHGLVADQGAGGRAGVDGQVELKGCCGSRRDRAGVDSRGERRNATIRLSDRRPVEQRGIRDVGRIRRNSVGQNDASGRQSRRSSAP